MKDKSEVIFLLIGIAFSIGLVPFFKIFFWMLETQRTNHPEYNWPKWSDFYFTFYLMCIWHLMRQLIVAIFFPICLSAGKPVEDQKLMEAKAHKAATYVYKTSYFFIATVIGFYVLKDVPYMPPMMGGSGSFMKLYDDGFLQKQPPYFLKYYVGQLAYHLEGLIMHLLQPKRNDFIEMALHHFVTVGLIAFSYMVNFTSIGSMVLFLHDWADIPASFVKCASETRYSSTTALTFLACMFVWFYSRLLVFPYLIYIGGFALEAPSVGGMNFLHWFFIGMLCVLLLLHYYWFSMFIKIGKRYLKTGDTTDRQYNVAKSMGNKDCAKRMQ